MAQHGYLHDRYDGDGFGRGDDDRSRSDRNDERSWRGREDDRSRRGGDASSHDRGSMFGGWSDDDRHSRDRHQDERGFFDRAGQEMSSWMGGDRGQSDGSGRGQWQDRSSQGGNWSGQQRGYGSAYQDSQGGGSDHSAFTSQGSQGSKRYSAHPDDHYRSWRDKQMEALDRDYQDYCREREQQFHSEFDSWRQNRQSQTQGSNQGSTSHSQSNELSNDAMELDQEANRGGEIEGAIASPMGAATMGTNNSENTTSAPGATGRGRR